MGLISGLVTLPLAPVRGTVWAAEQILSQAEGEFYDPAKIRRQLDDVDRMRVNGDLTEEEATTLEDELVDRLLVSRSRPVNREG